MPESYRNVVYARKPDWCRTCRSQIHPGSEIAHTLAARVYLPHHAECLYGPRPQMRIQCGVCALDIDRSERYDHRSIAGKRTAVHMRCGAGQQLPKPNRDPAYPETCRQRANERRIIKLQAKIAADADRVSNNCAVETPADERRVTGSESRSGPESPSDTPPQTGSRSRTNTSQSPQSHQSGHAHQPALPVPEDRTRLVPANR
jgi:hypothetical protein